MTNILLLLKLQVYNVFSINRLRQRRGRRTIYQLGLILLLVFLTAAYNFLTALSLVQMGQANLIPAYMIAVVSLLIFFFSLLQVNGILFNAKELDRLLVLPVRTWEIVCGKFAFLYLLNFLLALIFMLPAGLIWLLSGGQLVDVLLYSCLLLFIPLLPLCLASLFSFLISYLSARLVHQNLFSFLASLVLLLVLLAGSIWTMRGGQGRDVYQLLTGQLSQLYPPANLFLNGQAFWRSSLQLAGFSLVVAGIFLKILSSSYLRLHFLLEKSATPVKIRKRRRKSPFLALYCRELDNFLSSYLYLLNSGLGVILLLVFSLLLCFVKPQDLISYLPLGVSQDFLPLFLASLFSISNPAAAAISLEGGRIWLLQTLPVSMKEILWTKMGLTISLHLIGLAVSLPILFWRFSPTIPQLLTLVCLSLAYSFFTALQGIFINFHYPKWIWDNEIVVIKQSLSVVLSGLVGMLSVLLPLALHFFCQWQLTASLWLTTGLLAAVSLILYSYLSKQIYFKEVDD
ncbi:ABC transporter permease protein [Streptococcus sp. DD11]|uniref:ABC transporter permease n=1 Tax=Streptococcus sp. DD11 TaxID=1777879 RepID=UPI00079947AB|nr:ABC transporter permease [Streptococcus sp. DD11]KXT85813.1 ABC transporter permease protein [Streptococcus sp. DD11]